MHQRHILFDLVDEFFVIDSKRNQQPRHELFRVRTGALHNDHQQVF